MKMNDYSYNEINIGDVFEFKKTITTEDIESFIKLTGNTNPLHSDEEYAKTTRFKGIIVHGLHASSFFSTLFGMLCPGKRALCLTQNLNFKDAIYPNSEVVVRGVVKDKVDSIKVLVFTTQIISKGSVVVDGEAKVTILEDEK